MFIWQGFGFLAVVLPVIGYVGVVKLCQLVWGVAYTDGHSWPGALGTFVGALLVAVLAKKLDRPGRTLVDPGNGQVVVVKKRHTLFFVPMLYVAGILMVVAVGMLVFKTGSPL
jgi:hypothetical protein